MAAVDFAYDPAVPTPLCEIMGRNRSDKGAADGKAWHNYTTLYHGLWGAVRDRPLRIFELGLGTNDVTLPSNMGAGGRPGASLFGWAEYFPRASVFGADIDRKILFSGGRIQTYYCDQRSAPSVAALWEAPGLEQPFDIIIDDGLHEFAANVTFFENSVHKLSPTGVFVIEDVRNSNAHLYNAKIAEWRAIYPHKFSLIQIPTAQNDCDNTVVLVQARG